MAIIYKATDKVAIKIDDITIKIRPLKLEEKSQILAKLQKAQVEKDMMAIQDAALDPIRLCLMEIQGIETASGEAYELERKDGKLTEDCLSDLLNMPLSEKLSKVCSSTLNGIPSDFQIEGVSFEKSNSKKKLK